MPYGNRKPQERCRRGHAMTGNNVHVRKDGYRRCRICLRLAKRRWWNKKHGKPQEPL